MSPAAKRLDHDTLVALDRAHLVHPVASWRQHEQRGPTVLDSGHGAWLTDDRGHELLDAFAGLWCVNIGYGHESVVRAATEQMRKLPYATGYFHFGSEPAIRLAAKLVEITPAVAHARLPDARRLGSSGRGGALHRAVLERRRPAGARSTSSRSSAAITARRRPAPGLTALPVFPSRLRPAAADAALHRVAQSVPPSARRRCAGVDRVIGRRAAREGGRARRRERRSVLLRADPGIGRRDRAAARLAEGDARRGARARHPVRRRRGHHRLRPHRPDVRVRGRRRGARPDDARQGADRRATCRWARR